MEMDQEILQQLKERGTDFSKPHAIEFYVYFPTVEGAAQAGLEIEKRGFQVQVLFDPTGHRWLCLCIREMLAELDPIRAWKGELHETAKPWGGHCDAWGTQIEK